MWGVCAGQSLEQWRGELSAWLSRWGNASAALTDGVYSWYLSDALLDVQRAYDTFNADYSTACAFAEIAVAAKAGGKYKSPIYIFNNAWQPSVPIYSHGGSFNLTWAYHTWDYRAAFENWPTPSIQPFPNATDRALSSFLQSAWGQLMSNGKLDPAITAGWDSVDAVPGFPAHYGMQRISSPDLIPFEPNMFVTDLKANFCGNLAAFGFDSRFW